MATFSSIMTWKYIVKVFISVIILCNQAGLAFQEGRQIKKNVVDEHEKVNVQHLDGIGDRRKYVENPYSIDPQQDPVSPEMLGGIIIQHESQKLSAQLRWLSNDEIGITVMQVRCLLDKV